MWYLIMLFSYLKSSLVFMTTKVATNVSSNGGALSDLHLSQILSSIVYTVIGIFFFGITFYLITKIVPFSMRKEIEEDQNISLGIIIGAVFIGIAIIIAAAIQ